MNDEQQLKKIKARSRRWSLGKTWLELDAEEFYWLIEKMERMFKQIKLMKHAEDRWVPCPDHRDKINEEKRCYVCLNEKIEKQRDRIQEAYNKLCESYNLPQEILQKEINDLRSSFNIIWDANMRAVKMWHEAGNNLEVWPDAADLCVWLMKQNKELKEYKTDFQRDLCK